jgi:hypothetical protein
MERKRLDKEPEAGTPRTREKEFPIRRQDEIGNIPRGPAPASR